MEKYRYTRMLGEQGTKEETNVQRQETLAGVEGRQTEKLEIGRGDMCPTYQKNRYINKDNQ